MPAHEESPDEVRNRVIESLLDPSAYPHDVHEPVERISTHISDIFLAGDFAYKLKKPVNFGFCDFSTLELREKHCKRELEINQRLSSDVYLSVEPIVFDSTAKIYRVGGNGETVDWVLRMRRLNSGDQVDRLLEGGQAGESEINQIARLLADFHRSAPVAPPEFGTVKTVSEIVLSNLGRVDEHAPEELDSIAFANISAYDQAFLNRRGQLIAQRREANAPRLCHGDLHTGNIFIESDGDERRFQVIDSIEFNDSFVNIDPAADLAFLSMDLKRKGHFDLAEKLTHTYIEASGDEEIRPLLPFYESYRAMVRCMAASISAEQSGGTERDRNVENAIAYLKLANDIASGDRPQFLAIMAGVTGTGKSTIAKLLAEHWQAAHLQTDLIRRELAGLNPTERSGSDIEGGIYTQEMSEKTYAEMLRRAEVALADGKSVIMDGTHLRREFRSRSLEVSRRFNAFTIIVECSLEQQKALNRLKQRYSSGTSESEGRPEVYLKQIQTWEPVGDDEADVVARVNTGESEQAMAEGLFRQLWDGIVDSPE